MKKRLLVTAVAATMALSAMGALVACGDDETPAVNNADIAKQAIASVRSLYGNKEGDETPSSYDVIGQTPIEGVFYTVNWSVSSDVADYGNYVVVGGMDETTKMVTVSITKAEVVVEYTLTASITVGDATETASFTRKIPAGVAVGEDKQEVSLSFAEKAQRTEQTSTRQVWTQNNITLTNEKGASTTDVADSANPVRLYKSSTIRIEYPGMTDILFHSAALVGTSDYPANLKNSLEAANLGTVTIDGVNVKLTLTYPADVVEFTASAGQIRLASIDVVAYKNGLTDAQKLASAKAALDLAEKNYLTTGEYALPATQNTATVTWAVSGTSENVSISEGKLVVSSMPAAETEVTLTATLTIGEATDTKDITIKLIPLGLTNDGTLEHPYTPTEAKLVTALLPAGATGAADVYVRGYVIAPGTYSDQYGNFDDMYIADEAGVATTDAKAILVYRPKPDGTHLTTDGFNNGDLVTFKCKLQNYKPSDSEALVPELVSATCVAKEAVQRTDAQIVADAKAAVDLTKKTYSKVNEEVTLPATLRDATLSWAVTTETTLVEIAEGKLKIKSIPETATSITLTVTITSNSVTDTKTIAISVEPLQLAHAGTQADPFTLADIAAIGNILDNSDFYSDQQVFVKGYIVDPGSFSTQYNNYSYIYLVDEYAADKDKNSEGAIQLYRLGLDNVYVTGDGAIAKGDFITVKGYIQKYNNKVQVTYSGSTNPVAVDLIKAGVTRTDTEIVAAAKTAVTLASSYNAGEVELPTTLSGATLTWEVKSGTNATIAGSVMTLTEPSANAEVTVTVTIISGTVEDTKDITFTVLATTTKGTEADPYTVAEANAIAHELTDGAYLSVGDAAQLVHITGYVVDPGSYSTQYKNYSNIYIVDEWAANKDKTSTDAMLLYRLDWGEAVIAAHGNLHRGDQITVKGYIQHYVNKSNEHSYQITYQGQTNPTLIAKGTNARADADKVVDALAAVKATLDNVTVASPEGIVLPVSTEPDVTLAWSLASDNTATCATVSEGKLVVSALPESDETVKLTVTATCGDASDTKAVTVVVKAPEDDSVFTLTSNSFKVLDSTQSGSYAKYAGNQTVGDYTVKLTDVMPGTPKNYDKSTIQMKASSGKMELTGNFTKIVIVVVSTYAYSDTFNNVTVTAGTIVLTATHVKSEQTGVMNGNYEYLLHTFEYTVTGGDQTIEIAKKNSGAAYLASVVFTKAEETAPVNETPSNTLTPEAIVNDEH